MINLMKNILIYPNINNINRIFIIMVFFYPIFSLNVLFLKYILKTNLILNEMLIQELFQNPKLCLFLNHLLGHYLNQQQLYSNVS